MSTKIALITGSAGLIGSQSVYFFSSKGYRVIGIDNDMRSYFFGESSSTKESLEKLKSSVKEYEHHGVDIRDYTSLEKIFSLYSTDISIIIHTAAQPSHDWAAKEPLTDFSINALGTLNLLELTRIYCPKSIFIFTSTNKVYGERPNYLSLFEKELRWEIDFEKCKDLNFIGEDGSINENMSIDNTKHSVFGASKVSADVMCQEYGKYFGLNTGIFRGGCLTGPNHAGSELHGFLSYLIKCILHNRPYTIYGYKGKQVRDNIHSWDLVNMFWHFHENPRPGEVYNVGGGRDNSISILEAINLINKILGTDWSDYEVSKNNRIGDHIWYITDFSKFKNHYPDWNLEISLLDTINQMILFEKNNLQK